MNDVRAVVRHAWTRTEQVLRRTAFLVTLPPLRRYLRGRWEGPADIPPVGLVRFGDLRRLQPISREWGGDRGGAIDRYYVEKFLAAHRHDIRGAVLEVGGDAYSRQFGDDRVQRLDILEYPTAHNPKTTIVADLAAGDDLPSNAFDCVIATQTLQYIYDVRSAVATLHRILKPGGVALVTVPGISQLSRYGRWSELWCWHFTALSMRRLFSAQFATADVHTATHGNVLAATAFLYGVAGTELTAAELDHLDPDYELLITLRAQKDVRSEDQ